MGITSSNVRLLAEGGGDAFFRAASPAKFNTQPLYFLIQSREGNHKSLRGFGLIPTGALQHLSDYTAFDFINDLKERRIRIVGRSARTGLARQGRQKFGQLQAYALHNLF